MVYITIKSLTVRLSRTLQQVWTTPLILLNPLNVPLKNRLVGTTGSDTRSSISSLIEAMQKLREEFGQSPVWFFGSGSEHCLCGDILWQVTWPRFVELLQENQVKTIICVNMKNHSVSVWLTNYVHTSRPDWGDKVSLSLWTETSPVQLDQILNCGFSFLPLVPCSDTDTVRLCLDVLTEKSGLSRTWILLWRAGPRGPAGGRCHIVSIMCLIVVSCSIGRTIKGPGFTRLMADGDSGGLSWTTSGCL